MSLYGLSVHDKHNPDHTPPTNIPLSSRAADWYAMQEAEIPFNAYIVTLEYIRIN